jgi:hypothetical protein
LGYKIGGRAASGLVLALLLCGGATAQDQDIQTIPVQGVKNPEMKSYRAVWKGLDKFDDEHELAPAVPQLKFRIMASKSKGQCIGVCNTTGVAVAAPGEEFGLRIASNDLSVPVPIGADGYFVVPRNEDLYDGNADLILNQKQGNYKMSVEVRTPGLPENVRRLGDLRLECKVQVAIVKEEIPFWIVALANSVLLSRDWCMAKIGKDYTNYSFFSPAEVASAHLSDGERSIKLSTSKHGFNVKLGDKSWPDDALVRLEYATAPKIATAAPTAP